MTIWEKQYKKIGFASQREYPNENLIAFVKGNCKNGDKILELGCGSGANMWFLGREGYKTYGIDSSKTGIELCRKKLKKEHTKAILKVADMTELPFSDNFFDAIIDVVSLQHVKNKEAVLKEIYRCLKPNGKFFSYHATGGDIKKLFEYDFYIKLPSFKQFKNIQIDKLTRTYDNQRLKIEYSIINLIK